MARGTHRHPGTLCCRVRPIARQRHSTPPALFALGSRRQCNTHRGSPPRSQRYQQPPAKRTARNQLSNIVPPHCCLPSSSRRGTQAQRRKLHPALFRCSSTGTQTCRQNQHNSVPCNRRWRLLSTSLFRRSNLGNLRPRQLIRSRTFHTGRIVSSQLAPSNLTHTSLHRCAIRRRNTRRRFRPDTIRHRNTRPHQCATRHRNTRHLRYATRHCNTRLAFPTHTTGRHSKHRPQGATIHRNIRRLMPANQARNTATLGTLRNHCRSTGTPAATPSATLR